MKVKQILALLLGWMLLVGLCPVAALADALEDTAHAGYIVKLRDDAPVLYAAMGKAKPLGFGMYQVAYPADAAVLADIGAVEYVEPNVQLQLFGAVDEPDYKKGKQWYLSGEYGLQTEYAWAEGLDGSGVTVAVLDTGLYDHADFENVHILRDCGYNATGDGGDYGDIVWHGTGVTGVIAAGVNDYGIVGAAYGVNILPIRIMDSNRELYVDYLIEALHYAVEQQVDIINLSLGTQNPLRVLYDAVRAVLEAGIILTAAVGNDGNDVLNYPAAFPGVIGVGAIDRDGTVASYSQKNASVWVSAPGTAITTTYAQPNRYITTQGTSFSTPCVAALAAIAKQYALINGQSLTRDEFAQLLRLSALDAGDPGYDCSYGYGIVNAPRMLEMLRTRQVRYALNGGDWTGPAPETDYYPYGGAAVELTRQIPEKAGYFFGGWYDNENCDGAPVDSFVPAAGGPERTYYARWVEDVTAPAAVTLNGRAAEPDETGGTWTAYYPAGTALPEGESAVVEVSFAYTGNAYSLEYQTDWDEVHGCWNIRVTQHAGEEHYRADYYLVADNSSYHVPITIGPAETGIPERTVIFENTDGSYVTTVTDAAGNVRISAVGSDGRTMVALSLPAAPDGTTTFDDVTDDAWYAQEVGQAAAYGLFHGTAERRFSPETVMTRGMFFTTLYRLSGAPAYGADKAAFADVAATAWYARAANWSYVVGLTRGTGAATFLAEQDLSREQLVTVLFRYARLLGADSGKRAAIDGFPDGGSISAWAAEAMEWALAEGLILGRASGTGTHIAAGETVTRAETAVILCRFITYLRNK